MTLSPSSAGTPPDRSASKNAVRSPTGLSYPWRTRAAAWAIQADIAAARMIGDLRAAGCRPILLKGPAIAEWLYPGEFRPYTDVDLMVSPHDWSAAEAVLTAAGYHHRTSDGWFPEQPLPHADPWSRGDEPKIDLHRSLHFVADAEAAWEAVSAGTASILVAGVEAEIPGVTARTLHIALHAVRSGPFLVKPQSDLERAIRAVPTPTWQSAADLARQLGCLGEFAAGLSAIPEGAGVADQIGVGQVKSSVASAVRLGLGEPFARTVSSQLSLTKKARYVARKLVPPGGYLTIADPLAGRGGLWRLVARVRRPAVVTRRMFAARRHSARG